MDYIIVDFEWNRPHVASASIVHPFEFHSEIIEIGAVRLESTKYAKEKNGLTFQKYVKPRFYTIMNSEVSGLTKIRSNQLSKALPFRETINEFFKWCGEDFCLCTWGEDDIPVLFDNMLMHGMQLPENFYWCDLQRIFSYEIMNESLGTRWALDKAVDFLRLPMSRAHDALNDATNAKSICNRVNLEAYFEDYACRYVNYAEDRLKGIVAGILHDSWDEAHEDAELTGLKCPACKQNLKFDNWYRSARGSKIGYGYCACGIELFARWKHKKQSNRYGRTVLEMNDVLWDEYQDAVDREEQKMLSIAV